MEDLKRLYGEALDIFIQRLKEKNIEAQKITLNVEIKTFVMSFTFMAIFIKSG